VSKLLVAIGLAGALFVASPQNFFEHFGPEAQAVGWKLKTVIDSTGYVPTFRRAGL
jgi:hypothetical protein